MCNENQLYVQDSVYDNLGRYELYIFEHMFNMIVIEEALTE